MTLALLLVAAAQAACPSTGDCRVMPLGDSITDGYNVPGGYRVRLDALFTENGDAVDFVGSLRNGPGVLLDKEHEGHSGWRIDQIATILPNRLLRHTPDVLLVHLGTNDVFQGYDMANAPERLAGLVDTALGFDPDTTVLLAGIIPSSNASINAEIEVYNAEVEALAASYADAGYDVRYVDMYTGFPSWMLADGVHPNRAGYARMAGVWYAALETVLP